MQRLRLILGLMTALFVVFNALGCGESKKKKKKPQAYVIPSGSLTFNNVLSGDKKTKVISIQNLGAGALSIKSLSITGPDAGLFSFDLGATSLPVTLAVKKELIVPFTFAPTSFGYCQATLTIVHNDGSTLDYKTPYKLHLTGVGIAAGINATPDPCHFGHPYVGYFNEQTIALESIGTFPLNIFSLSISGPDKGEFNIVLSDGSLSKTDPNLTALPETRPDDSDTRYVKIWFTPNTVPGDKTAQLIVHHDGINHPATWAVDLSGTAIRPQFKITPPGRDFGKTPVGNTVQQIFVITNLSTTSLSISYIFPANYKNDSTYTTLPGEFTVLGISPSLPVTLLQNQTASYTVSFHPTVAGPKGANILIDHNNILMPPMLFPIGVSGEGTEARINFDPASYDYGSIFWNEGFEKRFYIINTGNQDLTITGLNIMSGPFQITTGYSAGSFTIPPSGRHLIGITAMPDNGYPSGSGFGDLYDALEIANDSNDNPILPVGLSGIAWSPITGHFVFVKAWGNNDVDSASPPFAVDASDNVYVAGSFLGTVDFDPGPGTANLTSNGYEDAYLVKFDFQGNLQWAHHYGGVSRDMASGGVAVGPGGEVYIGGKFVKIAGDNVNFGTGNIQGRAAGDFDCFLLKVDGPTGASQWVRILGSSMPDEVNAVAVDSSGNGYFAGLIYGSYNGINFNPDPLDEPPDIHLRRVSSSSCFLIKFDSTGNYIWGKDWRSGQGDSVLCLKTDIADNIYAGGYYSGTIDLDPGPGSNTFMCHGTSDAFIIKLNSDGDHLWSWGFGGNADDSAGRDSVRSIAVDRNFNTYVCGSFAGTADMDPGPGVNMKTSVGFQDIYLSKFDDQGVYKFTYTFGTVSPETATGLTCDDGGNVYMTGYFAYGGTIDFDPSLAVHSLTAYTGETMFLVKYKNSGAFEFAEKYGSTTGNVRPLGLANYMSVANSEIGVYVIGQFAGTNIDFDPLHSGPSSIVTSNGANYDSFLLKLK